MINFAENSMQSILCIMKVLRNGNVFVAAG